MRKYAILMLGQLLGASSVIFIKASGIQAGFLAADRLLLAALVLLPLYLRERRALAAAPGAVRLPWTRSVAPGVLLGLHLATWNLGARLTTATNASLIVNLVPVAMPFLVFFLMREKPRALELAGTAVSVGGLAALSLGSVGLDAATLAGDGVCLVSMLLVAGYLALGRRNAGGGLWTYLVPLYAVGGLSALLVSLPFGNPFAQPCAPADVAAVLGLTLVCTVGGHSINNWAMRHFRAQLVSLLGTTQFVWAGVAAWFCFREAPLAAFYPSSLVILAGAAIALWPSLGGRFGRGKAAKTGGEAAAPVDQA